MRFLKENYEGLQEVNTLSYFLRCVLSDPDIQELFKKNEFGTLYEKLEINSCELTKLLNSLGIDPLDYLDYIPKYFLNGAQITSVNIPDHIKRIDFNAFRQCSNLITIVIPNSVTSINSLAFSYCTSLTSVTIPDSVTHIGNWTFRDCTDLTSINYAGTKDQWKKVRKIPGWISGSTITDVKKIICKDGKVKL